MALEYASLDEKSLEPVLELVNNNLEYDNFSLDLFRHKTLEDPDFDPSLTTIVLSDGSPCGFMMGIIRSTEKGPKATIKLMVVDQACRKKGIASEMLERLESAARERGAKDLSVGFTRPNYFTPGLDVRYTAAAAFLLCRGFSKSGQIFNMDVDLSTSDWSTTALEENLTKEGIICRRLRKDEKSKLDSWIPEAGFGPSWQYQAARAADMEPAAVFIAEKAGDFIAFASYDGVRPGWFGPMGTSQNARGGGIGSVLLLKCLQDMKEKGYKVCEIGAVGPLSFYSKIVNATVSRIFWLFEKKL